MPLRHALRRDLRFAWRAGQRDRGFTAVAILTLGLAIGANSAAFRLIDALFLAPPPVRAPQELVAVTTAGPEGSLSYPDYLDLRERNHAFRDLAAYSFGPFGLNAGQGTEEVQAYVVTSNYFNVLGVRAARGRTLTPAARAAGDLPEIVVSHDFWRARLASDPNAVGRAVRLNGVPFAIVGIAPEGFRGTLRGFSPDIWVPVGVSGEAGLDARGRRWLVGVGRLRPGVSAGAAEAQLAVLGRQLAADHPQTNERVVFWVTPEWRLLMRQAPPLALVPGMVLALVGLVLLIACANLGSLLAARAISRQKEIALRVALGASRGDIVRQLLTEGALLALLGGAAGLLFATALGGGLWAWFERVSHLPGLRVDFAVDARMLGFTLGVAGASAVLFALLPALHASAVDVYAALKDRARGRHFVLGGNPARALLAGEVALATMLLVAAAVLAGPLRRALSLDLGYPLDGVLLANVHPQAAGYRGPRRDAFLADLVRRFEALPAVEAVALARGPVAAIGWPSYLPQSAFPDRNRHVVFGQAGAGLFATLRIPLAAGREFGPQDAAGSAPVVVINEVLADHLWPGQSAVGRSLLIWPDQPPAEVIGVVKAVRARPFFPPFPRLYLPLSQRSTDDALTLHVRLREPGAVPAGFIERELRAADPALPPPRVVSLRHRIQEDYALLRVGMTTLAGLGLSALLLAAIGLFGLTSYLVGERTQEIGVRRALGAGPGAILALVVGGTMRPVAAGLAVGLLAAAGAGQLVRGSVVGASLDPGAFVTAALLLAATALLAAYLPARRALGIEPMAALREE